MNRSVLSPPPSRFYFFFKPPTSECKYKNTRSGLACHVMGTIILVGERAKRARHSQVCSIENRGYYIYTRKMVGASELIAEIILYVR